jgi:hypothetical protein
MNIVVIIRWIESRKTRWAGHVARRVEKSDEYMILIRKSEGKE